MTAETGTVVVVGGGPAGMTAAIAAAENGRCVILIEKNEKLGRKLYLTGKGRCNVTNDSGTDEHMAHINANARFMYAALTAYGSGNVIRFFEAQGVPLKTERGRRVFPVSDRSADIVHALERSLRAANVDIRTGTAVLSVEAADNQVRGVRTDTGFIAADAVIVATGGLSYPSTGSTGDGYRFTRALGHRVTPLYPALTALRTAEPWVAGLEGVSLKNVHVSVIRKTPPGGKVLKPLYAETGEMLFTRDGVSGPVVLSASRFVTDHPDMTQLTLSIDLKPALSPEQLDRRILRDFTERANKDYANALDGLLPGRLIETVTELSGIPGNRKVNTLTREERLRLGYVLKHLDVTPVSTAGYGEAVITMGGVDVREINPSTMASKRVRGLYFAGEVLDVDAMTGGYNLQIAFSTGYLAGVSV